MEICHQNLGLQLIYLNLFSNHITGGLSGSICELQRILVLAHRPLAPGIRRRMFMPLLQTLEGRAVETLLVIELGQAGVQDVEAIKLLEDRLHQLDGAVRLLLVVGHGG